MKWPQKQIVVLLLALFAVPSDGQSDHIAATRAAQKILTVRIIDDPSTHQRWLLTRNLDRPEAPGTLIPASPESSLSPIAAGACETHLKIESERKRVPILRGGETLVLVEHTPTSDARLEAIALSGAAVGETLMVRLRIGGRSLKAIATGPRQASLVGEGH